MKIKVKKSSKGKKCNRASIKMRSLFPWVVREPHSPHLGCKHVVTSKQLNTDAHQMRGKLSRYLIFVSV